MGPLIRNQRQDSRRETVLAPTGTSTGGVRRVRFHMCFETRCADRSTVSSDRKKEGKDDFKNFNLKKKEILT